MAETKASRVLKCAAILETMPEGLTKQEFEAWIIANVGSYTFDEFELARRVVEWVEDRADD